MSEIDDLRHDIDRHLAICVEQEGRIAELEAFVGLYLKTYVNTQKHPTVSEEAAVMTEARRLSK